MATDTASLIQKVYDLFSTTYAAHSSNQAFLAFEPMGIPMSDGMFKLGTAPDYSQALAIERLSELGNKVVLVRDGSVVRGMETVENVAGLLLTSAMPINADAMVSLGAVKNGESSRFAATLGSLSGVPNEQYRPVYATPDDWYVAASTTDWTTHVVGDQPPPVSPPRVPVRMGPPIWRLLPIAQRPALATAVSAAHPLLSMQAGAAATPPHPFINLARIATLAPAIARPMPALAAAGSATQPVSGQQGPPATTAMTARAPLMFRRLELTSAFAKMTASTTPQDVTTDSISMSFEHCIVLLSRPWFPEELLMLRNWYLPGYGRGAISNGKGSDDTGLMPVLTTGFVAIRKLNITSKWTPRDLAAVQGAASFGPFSLIGRNYDQTSGTLASPGMQIIGWFCSALPVLPPLADPTLQATS